MLYMFQGVSPPIIRSSKTVDTASGICQACLLLPLAVATNKLDIYPIYTASGDGFGGLVVSMLAPGTQVCGFKPGRSRWIFWA